jgi:hypothetical protein
MPRKRVAGFTCALTQQSFDTKRQAAVVARAMWTSHSENRMDLFYSQRVTLSSLRMSEQRQLYVGG